MTKKLVRKWQASKPTTEIILRQFSSLSKENTPLLEKQLRLIRLVSSFRFEKEFILLS